MGIIINGQNDTIGPVDNTMSLLGTVSIGGTMTIEDFTNIDSVGLITARAGVKVPDNQKVFLGTGDDLSLYHNAANSFIDNTTGSLYIRGIGDDLYLRATDDILIQPQGSENGIKVIGDGAVELYHDNSKKLETTNTGAVVTGILTATTFIGNGANLTGLPEGTNVLKAMLFT